MLSRQWRTKMSVSLGQLRQLAVRFHLMRRVSLGIDGGGTKIRAVWLYRGHHITRRFDTRDFDEFAEMFSHVIGLMPKKPTRACLALAGSPQPDGTIVITNVTGWGAIDIEALEWLTGCRVEFVNDMVAAYEGLVDANRADMLLITRVRHLLARLVLVITISTGINDSTGKGVEAGHVGWQPFGDVEERYLRFGQDDVGSSLFTVEQAISGGQGWDRMFRFLRKYYQVSDDLRLALEQSTIGVSPVIEQFARDGDNLCLAIVELYVSILACHLRNRIVATGATEVVLIGSVATHLADFISPGGLFRADVLTRLCAPGAFADKRQVGPGSIYASSERRYLQLSAPTGSVA